MRHHPLGYHRPDVVTLRGYGRGMAGVNYNVITRWLAESAIRQGPEAAQVALDELALPEPALRARVEAAAASRPARATPMHSAPASVLPMGDESELSEPATPGETLSREEWLAEAERRARVASTFPFMSTQAMPPPPPGTLDGYGRRGMGGIQLFATPETDEASDPEVLGTTLLYPRGYTGGLSLWMAKRPVAWTLGLFAAGWAGGYLTWLAIGRKRR